MKLNSTLSDKNNSKEANVQQNEKEKVNSLSIKDDKSNIPDVIENKEIGKSLKGIITLESSSEAKEEKHMENKIDEKNLIESSGKIESKIAEDPLPKS